MPRNNPHPRPILDRIFTLVPHLRPDMPTDACLLLNNRIHKGPAESVDPTAQECYSTFTVFHPAAPGERATMPNRLSVNRFRVDHDQPPLLDGRDRVWATTVFTTQLPALEAQEGGPSQYIARASMRWRMEWRDRHPGQTTAGHRRFELSIDRALGSRGDTVHRYTWTNEDPAVLELVWEKPKSTPVRVAELVLADGQAELRLVRQPPTQDDAVFSSLAILGAELERVRGAVPESEGSALDALLMLSKSQ